MRHSERVVDVQLAAGLRGAGLDQVGDADPGERVGAEIVEPGRRRTRLSGSTSHTIATASRTALERIEPDGHVRPLDLDYLAVVVGAAHGAGRRGAAWADGIAGRQRGSARWPSTANDANACCCATFGAWERPRLVLLGVVDWSIVTDCRAASAGPAWVTVVVSVIGRDSSASRAPHRAHSPAQSSAQIGFSGSASTTASRSTGSRSTKSPSRTGTSSSSASRLVDEQLRDRYVEALGHRLQAAAALRRERRMQLGGDEDALDDRLQPQVELDAAARPARGPARAPSPAAPAARDGARASTPADAPARGCRGRRASAGQDALAGGRA